MNSKETLDRFMKMKHYEVIQTVREYLKLLPTDETRLEFIRNLGICLYCGSDVLPCYCVKDE